MALMHVWLCFKLSLVSLRLVLLIRVFNLFTSQLPVIVCLYLLPPSPTLVAFHLLPLLDPLGPPLLLGHQLGHHAPGPPSVLNCGPLHPECPLRLLLLQLCDHPEIMLLQRVMPLRRLDLLRADEISLLLALLLLLEFLLPPHLLHRVADHSILDETPVLPHFIIDILEFLRV